MPNFHHNHTSKTLHIVIEWVSERNIHQEFSLFNVSYTLRGIDCLFLIQLFLVKVNCWFYIRKNYSYVYISNITYMGVLTYNKIIIFPQISQYLKLTRICDIFFINIFVVVVEHFNFLYNWNQFDNIYTQPTTHDALAFARATVLVSIQKYVRSYGH
jgi:hypothetical protein